MTQACCPEAHPTHAQLPPLHGCLGEAIFREVRIFGGISILRSWHRFHFFSHFPERAGHPSTQLRGVRLYRGPNHICIYFVYAGYLTKWKVCGMGWAGVLWVPAGWAADCVGGGRPGACGGAHPHLGHRHHLSHPGGGLNHAVLLDLAGAASCPLHGFVFYPCFPIHLNRSHGSNQIPLFNESNSLVSLWYLLWLSSDTTCSLA